MKRFDFPFIVEGEFTLLGWIVFVTAIGLGVVVFTWGLGRLLGLN